MDDTPSKPPPSEANQHPLVRFIFKHPRWVDSLFIGLVILLVLVFVVGPVAGRAWRRAQINSRVNDPQFIVREEVEGVEWIEYDLRCYIERRLGVTGGWTKGPGDWLELSAGDLVSIGQAESPEAARQRAEAITRDRSPDRPPAVSHAWGRFIFIGFEGKAGVDRVMAFLREGKK